MATVPRLQRYYQGATTSCPRMSFGLLFSPSGSAGACRGSCPPMGRSRRRTGPATDRGLDFHAGNPLSSLFAHGQEQDLPGSLAIHPVTLRRSTTPDDPLRLAISPTSATRGQNTRPGGRGWLPTRGSHRSGLAQLRHPAPRIMVSLLNGTHCERLAPLGEDRFCVGARSGPMSCVPGDFADQAICATAVPFHIGIGAAPGSCR